jgi:hypothetical protein
VSGFRVKGTENARLSHIVRVIMFPSPSPPLFFTAAINHNPRIHTSLILATNSTPILNLSLPKPFPPHLYCSSTSNVDLSGDDSDVDEDESEYGDGVYLEIEKLEKSSRRIRSRIDIDAPLQTVWNILTDYERLADFIPGLAVCQLLQKKDNYARLFQVPFQFCLS